MNTVKALSSVFLLTCAAAFGQQAPVQMTDASVVQMVQSKISPDLIILAISKCTPSFQLDNGSMEYMLQQGVTEDIIKAMAAKQTGQPIPGFQQTSAVQPQNSIVQPQNFVQSTPPKLAVNSKTQYDSKLGTVDIGVGGGVFIDKNLVPAAHPAVMTTTSIALHKYVAAYGEFGYTHLASGLGNVYGYDVSGSAYLLDYGAGGKFTIPTGTRVVPYGTLGFGRSHVGVSESVSDLGFGASAAVWNFNFGGGINLFLTRNVGFNADFRAYRPSGDGYSAWYERAAFGVFYQFNNRTF